MRTSTTPADAITDVVIPLTNDERLYLKERVKCSMTVARSNMQDMSLPPELRDHYTEQYSLAIRLLTKLGA